MAGPGGKRLGAGRPKGAKSRATIAQCATLEELARSHTATALDVLVQVATASESDSARVSAANALLDRGYGKPKQATELTGKDGAPIEMSEMSDLEAVRRIRFLMDNAKAQQAKAH